MLLRHIWGLFASPVNEWRAIRDRNISANIAFIYALLLAAIPAVCGFVGTTQHGWEVGGGVQVSLTTQSAAVIAVLYYLVLLAAVFSVGWMIRWMGETYGAMQPFTRCLVLAVFIPVPLFLAGFFQLYPVLWLNLIVGIPALSYTVFLLYIGIPIMMEIPQERGFLFASAVLAFGLIGLVGVLAVTVLLWGIGIGPVFEF
jgi:hypothetical protein